MAVGAMKDWLTGNRMAPSWVLSGLFHAALVALLLWLMPFYHPPQPPGGGAQEPGREIGIVVKEPGDFQARSGPPRADAAAGAEDAEVAVTRDPLSPQSAASDLPAMDSALPQQESRPGIGPGAVRPGGGLPDPRDLNPPGKKGAAGGGNGSGIGGGIPGTAFMGIKDNATRVVYVIDTSGSMSSHNAIGQAKGALVASLNSLDPGQQFQIIFYSEEPRVMSLKSAPKKHLYFATDLNKTAANQFVQQIQPNAGTEHLTAIKLALSFSPEVLYVLTDSGDPRLSPRELDEIKKRNAGRTRIHCIEFGIGPELRGEAGNFLKKLARDNDGTCRYVDITAARRNAR